MFWIGFAAGFLLGACVVLGFGVWGALTDPDP
jgi:hypothetical protein